MSFDIKLDDAAMKDIVSAAIMQTMTAENRDTLIRAAITNLISPVSRGNYGSQNTSPLQDAFNYAVRNVAEKLVTEMLQDDAGLKGQIRNLVTAAMEQITNDDERREKLVSRLANNISETLSGRN